MSDLDHLQQNGEPRGNARVCRVLILSWTNQRLLVERVGDRPALPRFFFGADEPFTESLVRWAKSRYGLTTCCVFKGGYLDVCECGGHCFHQVLEVVGESDLPNFARWASPTLQPFEGPAHPCDARAIASAFEPSGSSKDAAEAMPFTIPGWFGQLTAWVQDQIAPRGQRLTGGFRQVGGGACSALLRFETDGSAVWFKAVAGESCREHDLSLLFSRLFRGKVADVIAVHPGIKGWLMAEAPGISLANTPEIVAWEFAGESLAQLQIDSISQVGSLIFSGCRNFGAPQLLQLVDPFMRSAMVLMKAQESRAAAILNQEQLLLLGDGVRTAISRLMRLPIPDALGNLDLNPGNILVGSGTCVFLDWAEAFIGNPFLAFELFYAHLCRSPIAESSRLSRVRDLYALRWRAIVSKSAVEEAQLLTPLLAPFVYALGTEAWQNPEAIGDGSTGKYLRAMIRRMWSESRLLRDREALWPA